MRPKLFGFISHKCFLGARFLNGKRNISQHNNILNELHEHPGQILREKPLLKEQNGFHFPPKSQSL